MIEKQTVEIALCDANECGHRTYADKDGNFSAGYELTIVEFDEGGEGNRFEAFACRLSHIGKAAKSVLARSHGEPGGEDGDAWDEGDSELADRDLAEASAR